MFYLYNPLNFAFFLCSQKPNCRADLLKSYPFIEINDLQYVPGLMDKIVNGTVFKPLYDADKLTAKEIYAYSHFQNSDNARRSTRFFMNYLIFGLFQAIAAVCAFLIRKNKGEWSKDMRGLFLVITINFSLKVLVILLVSRILFYGSSFRIMEISDFLYILFFIVGFILFRLLLHFSQVR